MLVEGENRLRVIGGSDGGEEITAPVPVGDHGVGAGGGRMNLVKKFLGENEMVMDLWVMGRKIFDSVFIYLFN